MAIDNLNFYSNGLPAGQLTDKYSSQPGCLRSKNLDIFSSSKSVKATAWSTPTTTDADVIKQDGKLLLKTDGKVYERTNNGDTLIVDPSVNFPIHQVSYTGKNGTYADVQRGTPQDLVAKYEGDELKSFVVYSDRASYLYSLVKFTPKKSFSYIKYLELDDEVKSNGYLFTKSQSYSTAQIQISVENAPFAEIPLKIYAIENAADDATISLASVKLKYPSGYYYDAELDGMEATRSLAVEDLSFSGNITDGITINAPIFPTYKGWEVIELNFEFTKKAGKNTYSWINGELYIDMNGGPTEDHRMTVSGEELDGDYNEYYGYLPMRDRKLVSVGDYGYSESFWMKGLSFQPLYKRVGTWAEIDGEKSIRYDFVTDMGWISDVSMDVIGMIIWNEQVYMIGNLDGNGYIIPCDLTGGRGTPYIAYGCEFKGVTNIDYLMYLVGEDRGISQLRVYNGQELVSIIGGTEEKGTKNLVDNVEQYRFDGRMVNYRKDLVLSTSDNRVFAYGQTYGGKGGTFIHQLPGTITDIKSEGKDLVIEYSVITNGTTTKYLTTYQDDTPIKRYNTEWMAEYPIVLGNHLLEKEESDLYASYILPNDECKLEFWGMANHYHFRTFKTDGNTTPTVGTKWYIDGSSGYYTLDFVEKNDGYLTFKLEGDLPIMTGSETMRIREYLVPAGQSYTYISFTEINHFRKIGEITTTEYQEGEFRFHNLNNKLELPKSHSLQIMVIGKGTTNYTPELFAVDLVANQRERG